MKAFTVFVNGQKVATLGIGNGGVLSAIVNWVGGRFRAEGGEFRLHLGGLDSVAREHLRWPAPPLAVGDEVTVRLLEVENVDPPTERTLGSPPASETHQGIRNRLAHFLGVWEAHQPEPWGRVLSSETGVKFRRGANGEASADVVYVPAGVTAGQPDGATRIDGVPVLAVEILAPHETIGEIDEKIDNCLDAGVPLVWVINPHWRTVKIYGQDAEPEMVNARQELSGEPQLPGFRVPVARLFA
jgi:Uma2 family endonuclease